jgi:hypothetical protein
MRNVKMHNENNLFGLLLRSSINSKLVIKIIMKINPIKPVSANTDINALCGVLPTPPVNSANPS